MAVLAWEDGPPPYPYGRDGMFNPFPALFIFGMYLGATVTPPVDDDAEPTELCVVRPNEFASCRVDCDLRMPPPVLLLLLPVLLIL
jgi:hypothetical protein